MEDIDKRLKFVEAMTKHGLKHFDGGGLAGGLASAVGETNNFTATNGLTNQDLTNQLANANTGVSNSQSFYNQMQPGVAQGLSSQNALAAQLQGMSNGQGPNPAQAQLAQNTAANTANQAALMAGQRGSSSNVGLMARQAAQQGAANQQNSIGQAATLGAQQQIAAQQNLQNLASTQVSQGGQALSGENQAAQGLYSISQNAAAAANSTNAQTAASNTAANNGIIGSIGGGLGSVLGFAKGGQVQMMAGGGTLNVQPTSPGGSWVGNWLNSSGPMKGGYTAPDTSSSNPLGALAGVAAGKGVKAVQNPMFGASSGPAMAGGAADAGGLADMGALALAADGGQIRQFASKGGPVEAESEQEEAVEPTKNDYANDKIPAMLSAGEVVMDHETLNDPGTIGHMARAVAAHIEQRNRSKK
jgi:hypothetical protein